MNFVADRYAFEQYLCDMEESKNHETDSSDKYDNTTQVKAAESQTVPSSQGSNQDPSITEYLSSADVEMG